MPDQDISAELREWLETGDIEGPLAETVRAAADEIDRLRAVYRLPTGSEIDLRAVPESERITGYPLAVCQACGADITPEDPDHA